jgi:hypothetical protein
MAVNEICELWFFTGRGQKAFIESESMTICVLV